jgi:hypothetical protein
MEHAVRTTGKKRRQGISFLSHGIMLPIRHIALNGGITLAMLKHLKGGDLATS